ncbi:MAG: hypothetical protein V2I67_15925 [Thermoanaerobaculales bacterium]|jgi:hypothetical protein|nr:hypothetical protein [Thermoanaerobaculales bacterium]
MRSLTILVVLTLLAAPCVAVDIPFKDGSVVEAVGYTVTGSYLMLDMPDGSKVAYDVGDIDLEALRAAEAVVEEKAAPSQEPATLGRAGSLALPDETETGGIAITDQHVKHVRGSGIAGPEDETEKEPPVDAGGVPEGFQEGGGVLTNNLKVAPQGDGQWLVTGEVINRTSAPVMDVQANLSIRVPDGDAITASVAVSGLLGPDEKAAFSHGFSAPADAGDGWTPSVGVNVVYMSSETKLEPAYNRTAPHPSALPFDRGGVSGVETRGEVEL